MDYTLEVSRGIGRARMALLGAAVLLAGLASPAAAAAISQGYQSAQVLAPDTLVAQATSGSQVIPADSAHANQLLGVVVTAGSSTLAVGSTSDTQVVTGGPATVFVTDLNGAVKTGDPITASPVQGVGMRATAAGKVIGVAQAAMSGSIKTISVATAAGGHVSAHLATVPVNVQVSYYNPQTATPKTTTPQFLQLFANSVAGKPVAIARLAVSTVILLVALCVVGIMLFSGVRGSMTALGRNPLAKRSIYQGLWQVLAATIVILAVALIGSYAVLTR